MANTGWQQYGCCNDPAGACFSVYCMPCMLCSIQPTLSSGKITFFCFVFFIVAGVVAEGVVAGVLLLYIFSIIIYTPHTSLCLFACCKCSLLILSSFPSTRSSCSPTKQRRFERSPWGLPRPLSRLMRLLRHLLLPTKHGAVLSYHRNQGRPSPQPWSTTAGTMRGLRILRSLLQYTLLLLSSVYRLCPVLGS